MTSQKEKKNNTFFTYSFLHTRVYGNEFFILKFLFVFLFRLKKKFKGGRKKERKRERIEKNLINQKKIVSILLKKKNCKILHNYFLKIFLISLMSGLEQIFFE